jgi:hypothetical protein
MTEHLSETEVFAMMEVSKMSDQQSVDRFLLQTFVRQGYYLARTATLLKTINQAVERFRNDMSSPSSFPFLEDGASPEHIWKVLDVYTMEDLLKNIKRFDELFMSWPNIHAYWLGMKRQARIQSALERQEKVKQE